MYDCANCEAAEEEAREVRKNRDDEMFKLRELLGWSRLELEEFLTIDRVPERTRKALAK